MADNTKIYRIEVQGISEAYDNVIKLKEALESLGSSKAKTATKELTDEQIKATQATKDHVEEVKNQTKVEKALQTIEANNQTTYREKQKLLTSLGTVIKNMTTDTEEQAQAQQELIDRYADLNSELKAFDKQMGNNQRSVGDYAIAGKSLKGELKEIQSQMAELLMQGKGNSAQYEELAKKAGAYKDALGDAADSVKRFASDTSKLDSVISVAQATASAFGLVQSSMAMLGVEDEDLIKTIEKLQATMTMLNSLQSFSEALQSQSFAGQLLRKTFAALTLQRTQDTTATVAQTVAQENLNKSMNQGTTATNNASGGFSKLGKAMRALPLLAIVAAAAMIWANWDKIQKVLEQNGITIKSIGDAFDKLKQIAMGAISVIIGRLRAMGTILGGIWDMLSGDWAQGWENMKRGFSDFGDFVTDYNNGVNNEIVRQNESKNKKLLEQENKLTKDKLEELKARKGNDAKYSKEGIELQKKDFKQRKELAKDNADELRKIELEELTFNREVQEHRVQASKEANQKILEDEKNRLEEEKKLAELRKNLDKDRYTSIKDYNEAVAEYYKESAETAREMANSYQPPFSEEQRKEIKKYFTDAEKDYRKYYETLEVIEVDAFENSKKELGEWFDERLDALDKQNLSAEEYAKEYNKLQETYSFNLQTLQMRHENKMIDIKRKANVEVANLTFEQVDKLKSYYDGLVETTEKVYGKDSDEYRNALFLKEQATKEGINKIDNDWASYLQYMESIYGKDSEEYKKALEDKAKARQEYLDSFKPKEEEVDWKTDNSIDSLFKRGAEQYGRNSGSAKGVEDMLKLAFGEDWEKDLEEKLGEGFGKGLNAALTTMTFYEETMMDIWEHQIEMLEDQLDRVDEMYDGVAEKVDESESRIDDLKNQLKEANAADKQAIQEQLAEEQVLYAERLAEQERLALEKQDLEAQIAEKEKKQKKMQLRTEQVMAIANTASAVAKTYSQWGWPLGTVFAAIIGAMGAMQVATIQQQISKLADGGLLSGPSHSQGGMRIQGTNIEVEGGEMVINKRATAQYLPLLEAINNSTLPKTRQKSYTKFADGGQLNVSSFQTQDYATNALLAAIGNKDTNPIVAVTDFNKVDNKLVRVRQYSGSSKR